MPCVSIIIPVFNEADRIVGFLQYMQALVKRHHSPTEEVEWIVVDGGSEDNTSELAEPYVNYVLSSPKGRARQMNAGIRQATGQTLLFLHCDTVLPERPLVLDDESNGKQYDWGFYSIRLSGQSRLLRVVEKMMTWRSGVTRVATGDQCLFIKRHVLDKLGPFADMPLMEDVEMSKRLRRYASPLIVPEAVVTSSRRWEERGIIKTIVLMWYLRALYFFGVSPRVLVKKYYG